MNIALSLGASLLVLLLWLIPLGYGLPQRDLRTTIEGPHGTPADGIMLHSPLAHFSLYKRLKLR